MPVDDLMDPLLRVSRTSEHRACAPCRSASRSRGMMLLAVPACIEPTVTTTDSSGSVSREAYQLQAGDDLRGNDDGIDRRIRASRHARRGRGRRFRSESAAAIDGPYARRELADRQAGPVVHAIDLADGEGLHHAVLHHERRRRRRLLPPAGKSPRQRRENCGSRSDIWPRRAAWRCGRRARRRA